MRIVSLVPSATEMLFALGLGADLIAVTHECDYPPAARELPKVTRDVLPARPDARRRSTPPSRSARWPASRSTSSTPTLLARAAARPDRHPGAVLGVRRLLRRRPRDRRGDRHPAARDLARPAHASARCSATPARSPRPPTARTPPSSWSASRPTGSIASASPCAAPGRPRVVALEWLDPPFAAGHWTPQLIDYAGGEDVLGLRRRELGGAHVGEVAAAQPDIVIVMPCGYDAEIAHREAEMHRDQLAALGAGEVVAVDAVRLLLAARAADHRRARAARAHPPPRAVPRGARPGADGRPLVGAARRGSFAKPMPFGVSPWLPATAIAANNADHRDHHATGQRQRRPAPALGELDEQAAGDQAPDQAAEVAADRDTATLSENTMLISSIRPRPLCQIGIRAVVARPRSARRAPRSTLPTRRPSATSGSNSSAPNDPATSEAK